VIFVYTVDFVDFDTCVQLDQKWQRQLTFLKSIGSETTFCLFIALRCDQTSFFTPLETTGCSAAVKLIGFWSTTEPVLSITSARLKAVVELRMHIGILLWSGIELGTQ